MQRISENPEEQYEAFITILRPDLAVRSGRRCGVAVSKETSEPGSIQIVGEHAKVRSYLTCYLKLDKSEVLDRMKKISGRM